MADDGRIPEPKGWPILGNILDIDLNFPLGSFNKFADKYGEYLHLILMSHSHCSANDLSSHNLSD
jgi:cytochrome P450/NADPH-cytochrome P450 reductase